MNQKKIVILGAGPAGLGAAYLLRKRYSHEVIVIEWNNFVGGNASSFEIDGLWVDFGSHRLHAACPPEVLADIKGMLGVDLLERPRHGRILLRKNWIHFPLKPVDLLLHLPPAFSWGVIVDNVRKILQRDPNSTGGDNFATLLQRSLGNTICKDFYFPYSKKIWGLDPLEISSTQAKRRISAGSVSKIIQRLMLTIPGIRKSSSRSHFYYPRYGFGQISQAYYKRAMDHGATIMLNCSIKTLERLDNAKYRISIEQNGILSETIADQVWSTIPITTLARIYQPSPSQEILLSANSINYRAMILVYLIIGTNQFSEFDAHYFPDEEIPITRLSEPKNYAAATEPSDRTVICAELPCSPGDAVWALSENELSDFVVRAIKKAGLEMNRPILRVVTKKLRHAYPIYQKGYEVYFNKLDNWVSNETGILSFGRQGLFAHDNTHHALFMAYSAVNCLDQQGTFDWVKWAEYRKIFETHVVED